MNVMAVAWIQDIVEIPPRLILTLGLLLLVAHVGTNNIISANSEHTKSDHSSLGSSVKGREQRGCSEFYH